MMRWLALGVILMLTACGGASSSGVAATGAAPASATPQATASAGGLVATPTVTPVPNEFPLPPPGILFGVAASYPESSPEP